MDYNCSVKQIVTTEVFDGWFTALRDKHGKARIQARIDRAQLGNFGDCEPVGEGVSEMRIHHGPGYRVYFVQRGLEVVILLAGGDKSSQTKDIKLALESYYYASEANRYQVLNAVAPRNLIDLFDDALTTSPTDAPARYYAHATRDPAAGQDNP